MEEYFDYAIRYWYPHMAPADRTIWERFIKLYPKAYDKVQYDVKLGTIPDFVKDHTDAVMQAEASLYQKKIDVIGYAGERIDIIELKPRAAFSAIGQVKGYVSLYLRDHTPPTTPNAVIITDALLPDVEHVASEQSVKIIVV